MSRFLVGSVVDSLRVARTPFCSSPSRASSCF
jgi:hypothetical protein